MAVKKNERPERTETDASLHRERKRTDEEIAKSLPQIEADADRVVEIARERAEATLDAARNIADAALDENNARPSVVAAVARGRTREDQALATEHRVADRALETERSDREAALAELLRIERDETDDRLELERLRSDDVVASRDDFLGIVSHDLRNLLGGIALSAGLLHRRAKDDPARVEAARIQRCTVRMARLVGDLIDVVSMEAGRLSIIPELHDARHMVSEAVETFTPIAAQKQISIAGSAPGEALRVPMDAARIQQVLANLIGNAIKFTDPGGAVEVLVAPTKGGAQFSVLDTGPGVDPDSASKIFDRFWQFAPDDRRGLGLGLYISRNIVEAHHGRIWLETRNTGGSAFHFELPNA